MANEQTTPLSRTLPLFTQNKILDEIAKRGQALPGHVTAVSGSIVSINFDVAGITLPGPVDMPLFGPEYIRYPVQVGDKGVAFPASVYIGEVSGLGNGAADLTLQGNLSTLVWFPCGNKNWAAPDDPNAVVIYGPNGVIMRDTASGTVTTLTPAGLAVTSSGTISFTVGGHSVVINSTGVIIDGKAFLTHHHLPGTYNVGGNAVTGDSGDVQ